MRRIAAAACFLSAFLFLSGASAQTPEYLNYQGRLVSGTNLVNGTVGLTLRLWPGAFSLPFAQPLYEDSNNVTVVDGLYSTFLGDDTISGTLTNALTNATLYVEVAVNGVAMAPRERLASVGYALRSANAGNASYAASAGSYTGAVVDTQLSTNIVRLDGATNRFSGVIAGNGALITNLTGASIAANTITHTNLALPLNLTGSNYPDALLFVKNHGGGPAIWAEATNASGLAAINWGDGNALFVANLGSGPSAVIQGGEVGIGTQTPDEKLTVNGRVHSRVGGFKFPDGTIQETAVAGGWQGGSSNSTYILEGNLGLGTATPSNMIHLSRDFDTVDIRFEALRVAGQVFATTNATATVDQLGSGGTWSLLNNVFTSDNARASATFNYDGSRYLVRYIAFTNLGLAIPSNAIILNAILDWEGFKSNSLVCPGNEVTLTASLYRTNPIAPLILKSVVLANDVDATKTFDFGQAGGVFGSALTPSEVSSGAFGFGIAAEVNYGACAPGASKASIHLDQLRARVVYLVPSSTVTVINYAMGVPSGQVNFAISPGGAPVMPSNSTNDGGIVMDTNGWVGIGVAAPSFTFHVDGSAGKPGGGSWSVPSDERLKENIKPLAGTLEKLLALHGVTFNYKDPAALHELSGERIGLLAQEVEKVFPDWVETAPDGFKRLTVRGFEALAVEALRDLRAEKDRELRGLQKQSDAKIEELQTQLNEVLQRLRALEAK